MITLKPDAKITIMMPHQNKALGILMSLATPVQLEQLKEGKDLKSVVDSLLQSKMTNTKSDQVLLDILKNNTVFKQFGNFTHELKNVLSTLKEIPQLEPKLTKLEASLKSIEKLDLPTLKGQIANSGVFMESKIAAAAVPMQTVREALQSLQVSLTKTSHSEAKNISVALGEFLENPVIQKAGEEIGSARVLIKTLQTLTDTIERILPKIDPITPPEIKTVENIHTDLKKLTLFTKPEHLLIQSQMEEHLSSDVKSQLMKLSDELKTLSTPVSTDVQTKVDQLITNIDYHQLLSHLDGSNTLYFPFSWDRLEEGSLSFKKREGKKFYCEINLQLKEYGKIDLMMGLYEENQLEIQIHTQDPKLKNLIEENLSTLRALLVDAGIVPRAIRIMDIKETITPSHSAYTPDSTDFQSGFEIKV